MDNYFAYDKITESQDLLRINRYGKATTNNSSVCDRPFRCAQGVCIVMQPHGRDHTKRLSSLVVKIS